MTEYDANLDDKNIQSESIEIDRTHNILNQSRIGISLAYCFLLLALVAIFPVIFAYLISFYMSKRHHQELWIGTHADWIMRNSLIFSMLIFFAGLWFIPLFFVVWDFNIWVKASTVIGAIFMLIAFLYLLNAWLKGIGQLIFKKAVF